GHRARQRVADPDRDSRRRRLAFLHHVEMGVEGRDLVDLRERELHLGRERGEMRGRKVAVTVLDQMQMLDQEIALARALAEQRAHLLDRLRLELATLGGAPGPPAAASARAICCAARKGCGVHWSLSMAHWGSAGIAQPPCYYPTIEIFYRRDYLITSEG